MEKINLVEILKNCPRGMELNCVAYDNVSFDKISSDKKATYPIFCYITDEEGNRSSISFTENGCESKRYGAKCVIFPKGKTTWEGFCRPFKDGDIIYNRLQKRICIYHKKSDISCIGYCRYNEYHKTFELLDANIYIIKQDYRLATEEEKQKLFYAIKEHGYKWNPETKTLDKLVKPKFKVGDKIVNDGYLVEIIEVDIEGEVYGYKSKIGGVGGLLFIDQDAWELVDKFDVTTFKPFDKVLARCSSLEKWRIQFFEKFDKTCKFPFICMGYNKYTQCIPYEGNEHLLDTADSCSDYYQI